ncbi:MAG TPA: extracellular solute-binding protein [Steroidobacter sp.]|uniref:ABC transporter substrate-binding protein n=1 Tax=Steroidobacter sp. TaxID=1978227 RepID=UPI002ED7E66B
MKHRLYRLALAACFVLGNHVVGAASTSSDCSAPLAAAKSEKRLLIYSNVADYNWKPILDAFARRYSWIRVETLDMGPSEAFERYYAESAAGKSSADLIVTGAPDAWQRFVQRAQVEPYSSCEAASLPAWSMPFEGLYTFSTDPMVLVYNKVLLGPSERPGSLGNLVAIAEANPQRFKGKFATYNAASHSFAYVIHWTVVHQQGEAGWNTLQRLAPFTRPEAGGSAMVEKVTTGEYVAAFYVSGVAAFPKLMNTKLEKLVGWSLIGDGTPVVTRGMAITKHAANKNAARLLLDFILSHEGQVAAARGGMTPYREDVLDSEVPFFTYRKLKAHLGAPRNTILTTYHPGLIEEREAFLDRWDGLFPMKK